MGDLSKSLSQQRGRVRCEPRQTNSMAVVLTTTLKDFFSPKFFFHAFDEDYGKMLSLSVLRLQNRTGLENTGNLRVFPQGLTLKVGIPTTPLVGVD